MKRILTVAIAVGVVGLAAGVALAYMGGPMGAGMGGGRMGYGMMGGGMMGPGMMGGGPGPAGCPGMAGMAGTPGAAPAPAQIGEDKAKELAQGYADKYLKGFTVEKILPFTMHRGTAYSVELKGPNDEVRTFHVNPWGNVMPFGPGRRPS